MPHFLGGSPAVVERRLLLVARGLAFLALCATSVLGAETDRANADAIHVAGRDGHAMLTRLCDDFGGRMTGSPANRSAMNRLAEELRAVGVKPVLVPFSMPGWERHEDRVIVTAPFSRTLRTAALSYTPPTKAFESEVIDLNQGRDSDYPSDSRGRIGLISPSTTLQTRALVRIAASHGMRGLLFINREAGGQLLARTGSFIGETLPLPVFSVTQEEGNWLQRLRARGETVKVRMESTSRSREIETANLTVTIPGRSAETIVVGAHFDSWDLSQGAMDNGLGVAQLYALAVALAKAPLELTVQLVWLNGEEQGLWGSRWQAAHLGEAPIVAMINLDMVGVPIGVNALGDQSLVPALQRWHNSVGSPSLPRGVENINWFGSDHTSYQLAGVRTITFNAPIPRESVRYYHDMADTIDKLPEAIVVDSSAAIYSLVRALAADRELSAVRRESGATEKLFTDFNLEPQMKAVGLWPFKS